MRSTMRALAREASYLHRLGGLVSNSVHVSRFARVVDGNVIGSFAQNQICLAIRSDRAHTSFTGCGTIQARCR